VFIEGRNENQEIKMRYLSERSRIIYDKLVQLAGGDRDITLKVLSNPLRDSVSLPNAQKEIELLRDLKKKDPGLVEAFIRGSRRRKEIRAIYNTLMSSPAPTLEDLETSIRKHVGSGPVPV
jgi:hypothetical protein